MNSISLEKGLKAVAIWKHDHAGDHGRQDNLSHRRVVDRHYSLKLQLFGYDALRRVLVAPRFV